MGQVRGWAVSKVKDQSGLCFRVVSPGLRGEDDEDGRPQHLICWLRGLCRAGALREQLHNMYNTATRASRRADTIDHFDAGGLAKLG